MFLLFSFVFRLFSSAFLFTQNSLSTHTLSLFLPALWQPNPTAMRRSSPHKGPDNPATRGIKEREKSERVMNGLGLCRAPLEVRLLSKSPFTDETVIECALPTMSGGWTDDRCGNIHGGLERHRAKCAKVSHRSPFLSSAPCPLDQSLQQPGDVADLQLGKPYNELSSQHGKRTLRRSSSSIAFGTSTPNNSITLNRTELFSNDRLYGRQRHSGNYTINASSGSSTSRNSNMSNYRVASIPITPFNHGTAMSTIRGEQLVMIPPSSSSRSGRGGRGFDIYNHSSKKYSVIAAGSPAGAPTSLSALNITGNVTCEGNTLVEGSGSELDMFDNELNTRSPHSRSSPSSTTSPTASQSVYRGGFSSYSSRPTTHCLSRSQPIYHTTERGNTAGGSLRRTQTFAALPRPISPNLTLATDDD